MQSLRKPKFDSYTGCFAIIALVLVVLSGCTADKRSESERVNAARVSLESHNYREAIIEARNLLRQNKDNVDARLILSVALLEVGDMKGAEKEATRARDLGASPSQYLETLARAMYGSGDHVAVIAQIDPGDISDPTLGSTLRALRGRSMLELGSTDQALMTFDKELEIGLSNEAQRISLLGKAMIAESAQDLEQAEALIKQALNITPNHPEALLALGRIYLSQSKFSEAKNLLRPARVVLENAKVQDRFYIEGQYTEALLGLGDIDAARQSTDVMEGIGIAHPMLVYLKGRIEFDSGNIDLAIQNFLQILAEYPRYTPAQTLMGIAMIQREDFPQAEMFLAQAVASDPDNLRARRLLAETRMRMGRNRDAVQTLERGLTQDDTDVALLSMLGRAMMRSGEEEKGIEHLIAAYNADPTNQQAGIVLASAYLSLGNSKQAIIVLNSIPAGSIDENRRRVLINVANIDKNDPAKAEQQIENLLAEATPGDNYITALAGSFYAATEQPDRARTMFRQILEMDPANRSAMLNILNLDERLGDYSESQALFEAAHAKDKSELLPTMVLARIYQSKGEEQRALQIITEANQRDPSILLPNLMLAAEALRNNDYATAEQFSETAVRTYPRSAWAQALSGLAKMNLGKLDESRSAFQQAVDQSPETVDYHFYLGKTAWATGHLITARASFIEAVERDNQHLPALRSLAILQANLGRIDKAETLIQDIETRFDNDRAAFVAVGDIRAAQGKHEQAIIAYEAAQKIDLSWYVALELYTVRNASKASDPMQSLKVWKEHAPNDPRPVLRMAQYHHKVGNLDKAISGYENGLTLQPESVLTMNNLAWLYFDRAKSGDREQALLMALQAYELSKQDPAIADTYGWLLFRQGDVEQGRNILREALQKTTPEKSPDIAYHFAVTLEDKVGSRSSAQEILKIALSSQLPFANRAEAQLLYDALVQEMKLIEEKRVEEERLSREGR